MGLNPSPIDLAMMAQAVQLSRLGFPAPNPRVGCVLAYGDTIVGKGYHDHAGGPHAEVVALQEAGQAAKGATAYVTLEPCRHEGRTPPCVNALLQHRISRVVIACVDPVAAHSGGVEILRSAGVEVVVGVMKEAAREANLAWLLAAERESPYVIVKAAITLDGRIATPAGESKWITGAEARAEAHRIRAECGAVLVGRATVETDDPSLTVRGVQIVNQPVRVVLDPRRKLLSDSAVFKGEGLAIRVVAGEPGDGEVSAPTREGRFDLVFLMKDLYRRGMTSLLVEGGAKTIGSFFDAGLVDRLELFVAGRVFGAGKSWIERPFSGGMDTPSFQILNLRRVGNDAWISCVPRVGRR